MDKKLLILTLALIIPLASASYISGDIEILTDGRAVFNVETDTQLDIPELQYNENKLTGTTNSLTIKEGEIWTLNLNFPEYDEIFLEIKLPKNLEEITQIRGNNNIIDLEKKLIIVIDTGKLDFSVKYSLGNYVSYSFLLWPLIAILIIIGFLFYKKTQRKKEMLSHIMPIINENEQKIIDLLMKKPMRQKEIRKILEIPKASYSRYLVNLEKKKLIVREGEGKNKIVKLK